MMSEAVFIARPMGLRSSLRARAVLGALVFALVAGLFGCGDPGTGGSGVPTASAPDASAPNASAPNASAPATSTPANDGQTGATPVAGIAAGQQTRYGPIESVAPAPAGQLPAEIVVAGIRFALGGATIAGADGQARNATDLRPGVPATVGIPPSADLAAAAANGTGPAVAATTVLLEAAARGELVAGPGAAVVRFDDGRTVAVAASAAVAGQPGPGNRVLAWVATPAGAASQVTRYEFE